MASVCSSMRVRGQMRCRVLPPEGEPRTLQWGHGIGDAQQLDGRPAARESKTKRGIIGPTPGKQSGHCAQSKRASKQASEQGSVSNRVVDDEHRLAIAASCRASSPPLDGIQGSRHAHAAGTRTCAERARTLAVMPANITSVLMPANIRPARTALCSRQAVINMGLGWERPKPWRRGGGCVPRRLRRRASSPAKGLLPHLRTPDGGVVA